VTTAPAVPVPTVVKTLAAGTAEATWSTPAPTVTLAAVTVPGTASLEYAAGGVAHYEAGSAATHYQAEDTPVHAAAELSRLHVTAVGRLHCQALGRLQYLAPGGIDYSPAIDVVDYSGSGLPHFEAEGDTDYTSTDTRVHFEAVL